MCLRYLGEESQCRSHEEVSEAPNILGFSHWTSSTTSREAWTINWFM